MQYRRTGNDDVHHRGPSAGRRAEILFQFTGDRAQGQQITVRLDADGKYSTVEDEALLGNYEADTDEDDDASDSAEAESPNSTEKHRTAPSSTEQHRY